MIVFPSVARRSGGGGHSRHGQDAGATARTGRAGRAGSAGPPRERLGVSRRTGRPYGRRSRVCWTNCELKEPDVSDIKKSRRDRLRIDGAWYRAGERRLRLRDGGARGERRTAPGRSWRNRQAAEPGRGEGKLEAADRDATLGRLSGTVSLEDLADCDIIIEAIVEDIEVKKDLFGVLDRQCPGLERSSLQYLQSHGHRDGSLHGPPGSFRGPALLQSRSDHEAGRGRAHRRHVGSATFDRAFAFARSLGKVPIACTDNFGLRREPPCWCPTCSTRSGAYEEGIGSIEDIDTGMKLGCGYPMGPFILGDFVGLDTLYYIAEIMFGEYREKRFAPPPTAQTHVPGRVSRAEGRKGLLRLLWR